MSKYAQLITSFEREGNFPLEANYIFPTEEALKQFFSEGVPAATLHKGLLKQQRGILMGTKLYIG